MISAVLYLIYYLFFSVLCPCNERYVMFLFSELYSYKWKLEMCVCLQQRSLATPMFTYNQVLLKLTTKVYLVYQDVLHGSLIRFKSWFWSSFVWNVELNSKIWKNWEKSGEKWKHVAWSNMSLNPTWAANVTEKLIFSF